MESSTGSQLASGPLGARAYDRPGLPGVRTGGAGEELFVLKPLPPADGIPQAADIASFGFGGGRPPRRVERSTRTPITVRVRHCELSYARHPVMVGHYAGDTIVSAESVQDYVEPEAQEADAWPELARARELGLSQVRL